jgi:hypothetical protein
MPESLSEGRAEQRTGHDGIMNKGGLMKRGICMMAVLAAGLLVVACTSGTEEKAQSTRVGVGSSLAKVEVFVKEACGATVPTIELVKSTLEGMKGSYDLKVIYVNSHDRAKELKVIGSPTVRVNGVDIEPGAAAKQKYGIT